MDWDDEYDNGYNDRDFASLRDNSIPDKGSSEGGFDPMDIANPWWKAGRYVASLIMLCVLREVGVRYPAYPAQGLINPYPALPRPLRQIAPYLWYEP